MNGKIRNFSVSALAAFIALVCLTGCVALRTAARGPGVGPSGAEELLRASAEFTDCWYWRLDEGCFQGFLAKGSPYVAAYGFAMFQSGFVSYPPDRGTWRIRTGYFDRTSTVHPLERFIRNGPDRDRFFLFDGDRRTLKKIWNTVGFSSHPIDGFGKHLNLIPDSAGHRRYALVLYRVSGHGYKQGWVLVFWVRENDQWKVFSFTTASHHSDLREPLKAARFLFLQEYQQLFKRHCVYDVRLFCPAAACLPDAVFKK